MISWQGAFYKQSFHKYSGYTHQWVLSEAPSVTLVIEAIFASVYTENRFHHNPLKLKGYDETYFSGEG